MQEQASAAAEITESRRIVLLSTGVAGRMVLGIHVLAWLFPAPPPQAAFVATVLLVCCSAAMAGRAAFAFDEIVRIRWPRWRWLMRVLVFGLVVLVSLDATDSVISAKDIAVPPYLVLVVFAYGAAVSAVLAGLLELVERSLARLRRLRTRLIWLGLISAGSSMALYAFFSLIIHSESGKLTALAWSVQMGLTAFVVWGVAQVLARPMASRLEQLSAAVHEVSRGNLEVSIPDEGRDELSGLARALKLMTADLRRYVTPAVLFALRRHQEGQISSERREITVLFFDLRGFTALSEAMSSEDVIRMLDFLFERMIEIVEARDGYINRFTGDGMMVVFGAPADRADHAQAAVECAIAMQAKMRELNAAHAFGAERPLEIGVGVNTGAVVAGAVGNADREEYTMIGDCVNVASRLCNSAAGGEILIGAASVAASGIAAEALPPLSVKGKSAPLEVYRVAA